eukprot:955643-Amphidinium_carterae.1
METVLNKHINSVTKSCDQNCLQHSQTRSTVVFQMRARRTRKNSSTASAQKLKPEGTTRGYSSRE